MKHTSKEQRSHNVAENLIHSFMQKAERHGWAGVIYIVPNPDTTSELNRVIGSCGGEAESLKAVMAHANTKVLAKVKLAEKMAGPADPSDPFCLDQAQEIP